MKKFLLLSIVALGALIVSCSNDDNQRKELYSSDSLSQKNAYPEDLETLKDIAIREVDYRINNDYKILDKDIAVSYEGDVDYAKGAAYIQVGIHCFYVSWSEVNDAYGNYHHTVYTGSYLGSGSPDLCKP